MSEKSEFHEIERLKRKCAESELMIKTLQRKLNKQKQREKDNVQKCTQKKVQEILSSVFTPGQIKILLNPCKKKRIGLQKT